MVELRNEEIAKQFELIASAIRNGKQLQVRVRGEAKWLNQGLGGNFSPSTCEYRIKPEPLEIYAVVDNDRKSTGSQVWHYSSTSWEKAIEYAQHYKNARVIKLREVEE